MAERLKLTRKEEQALTSIESFVAKNGYAPTVREVADLMRYQSSSTAYGVIERLEKKGYISKETAGPRTIRVLKSSSEVTGKTYNGTVKFKLSYCGADEELEVDAEGMSKNEVEKELVQWVLEHVDHWIEE